ncbi:hypothetical protein DEO72_LG11g1753 [Vigna unguiculata]|uniref:Uncharacterized protein n=1 Tax=Vigna unguiculata TaxID=3917 RepID=A0A4D6NN28_VIGUN|nr:hypothetical protein DEO72_LG11g1753 [Vigna unguiculata]
MAATTTTILSVHAPHHCTCSISDGGVVRDRHMVFRAVDEIMPKTFKEISN